MALSLLQVKEMAQTCSNKRTPTRTKIVAVLLILIIEAGLAWFVWTHSKPSARLGYIVKNGNSYILFWRDENLAPVVKNYAYLHEALNFAEEELNLRMGVNPQFDGSVEGVWERQDVGKHLIFWKTSELNVLHRLTFRRVTEAKLFARAFKSGAYSPSPYGHSIFLAPLE